MEEGICFSLYFIKLTIVFLWYLSLAIVKDREMYTFIHLKPKLNASGCVYGRIVILKNYIIIKKHLDHRMKLLT
jgi:hypothetical protein